MNKLIPLLLVVIVISTSPAYAHKLIGVNDANTIFETATHFPNPFNDSYFTLEEFTRVGQSHWYSFEGIEGQNIFIQTFVPNIEHSSDFTPCFDLILDGQKITPKVMREVYIEDLSNTEWFKTCETHITLSKSGFFFIRAHDELNHYSQGDIGKFSMSVGTVENFSWIDVIQIPIWILQIHVFLGNLMFVWLILLMIILVGALIAFALERNRHKN